jgi:hypothetical protein
LRSCRGCQCEVPDDSDSCPRCGALVPRGFFAALAGLFRGKAGESPATPPAGAAAAAPAARRASVADGDSFLLEVEDVFSISGRGTVVTGLVARGRIAVGDEVSFRTTKGSIARCRVNGVEMFRKLKQEAVAGDTVALLLSKIGHADIARGTAIERA